jgi:hypothetical protein
MSSTSLKRFFSTIEVNPLLWIAAALVTKSAIVVILGFVLAAVLQHRACYDLYMRVSRLPGKPHPAA